MKGAVVRGARQIVLLCAGLDSRAHWFRQMLEGVTVFEVEKVAALFKISRSMRRVFTSRRRVESSSRSAVVRAPLGPRPASVSA
ncbi:MAG: class I SAM-dependent methyltransferase [Myxococcales bacterium]|nr:class I SAM-dependent methyltransferase [Myxococcales bacterium]